MNLYIASGYTVTGYGCDTTAVVVTWDPNQDVLYPPAFSRALNNLGGQTRSVSSLSNVAPSGFTSSAPQVKKHVHFLLHHAIEQVYEVKLDTATQ